jgi:pimeloyl-ACP methyl ester carboxylesterase
MTKTRLPTAAKLGIAAAALGVAAWFNRAAARKAEAGYPPEGKFVEVDGLRLHFVERGDGTPLVLLHGMGALVQDFLGSGIVDKLAGRHRVIVFDRPGYGYSDRPRGRMWTPEAQAALVRAALTKLGIHRTLVLGHSWGTLPALALALDFPDEVAGLVLVSGPYFPVKRPDPILMALPSLPFLGALMANTVSPLGVRLSGPAMLKAIFSPNPVPPDFDERFPRGLALRPKHIRATAGDAGLLQAAELRLPKRYGELRMAVAIVAGDGDKLVPFAQAERMHAAVPHSSFHPAPGVGHMVHWIRPEVVLNAVEAVARG